MDIIETADALREHFGAINPLAEKKVLPALDHHARAFIALSPLLVLASADAHGRSDASPRGDAPGFCRVLDDVTLFLPDRPGNKRVDSFQNILERPGIGLLFFVPGIDETLRVNGRGRVVTDADLLAASEVHGKIPTTGLLIDVEEMFFHCGKALKRSALWDYSRHVERSSFPSLGRIIAEQTGKMSVEEAERTTAEGYRIRLY